MKFRVLAYVPDVLHYFLTFFTVNFKSLVGEQIGVMRLTIKLNVINSIKRISYIKI